MATLPEICYQFTSSNLFLDLRPSPLAPDTGGPATAGRNPGWTGQVEYMVLGWRYLIQLEAGFQNLLIQPEGAMTLGT